MGHFGFSYVGFVFLLALFIPNILWARKIPEGYTAAHEAKELVIAEKLGQVLATTSLLVFNDINIVPERGWWNIWFIIAALLMVLYELVWCRYFRRPSLTRFYAPLGFIPVPLASLPVCAFLLLGIYGKVIWIVLAAIILGIGHVGIHLQHVREMRP